MKFPFAASAFLILRSRVSAVNGFAPSPLTTLASSVSGRGRISSRTLAFIGRGGGIHKATISPDNETSRSSSSSDDSNDDDGLGDIIKAAKASRAITGSSLQISKFADLQYVDTRTLTAKKQHRVLFVLGGPGAGKGTQSERIVDTYKCIHLSVGELLREERKRGDASPHAELIESCLVAGKIVPVEISLNLVRNAMDDACASTGDSAHKYGQPIFLVDGFPRNFDNLSGWTENMPEYAAAIGSLVYDCPIEVLEKRIMSRAETSGRSDDNLESARKRFRTFQGQTMPVVYALEEVERMEKEEDGTSKMKIQHIVGEGTIEEVWDSTKAAMDEYVTNDVLTANSLLIQSIEEKNFDQYSQLCSEKMLQSNVNDDDSKGTTISSEEMFNKYEVVNGVTTPKSHISNATVNIQDGTKVIVNYDRRIEDESGNVITEFRETRIWSHEEEGWVCVHFIRKPLSEP